MLTLKHTSLRKTSLRSVMSVAFMQRNAVSRKVNVDRSLTTADIQSRLKVPQVASLSSDPQARSGEVVQLTTTGEFYGSDGSAWVLLGGGASLYYQVWVQGATPSYTLAAGTDQLLDIQVGTPSQSNYPSGVTAPTCPAGSIAVPPGRWRITAEAFFSRDADPGNGNYNIQVRLGIVTSGIAPPPLTDFVSLTSQMLSADNAQDAFLAASGEFTVPAGSTRFVGIYASNDSASYDTNINMIVVGWVVGLTRVAPI